MAYGQTGSGKTFTMGSEAHADIGVSETTGLIPRFMNDLFASLQRKQEAGSCKQAAAASSSIHQKDGETNTASGSVTSPTSSLVEYSIEASFLEVYGEDVHDLLQPSRPPVPIREDANGGVVCSGLSQKTVRTAQAALQVLHEGTLNRTTAATLMNLTSSRSHAVFAVTLNQTTLGPDGVEVSATSRFTFVDLAGSERLKKTGAEGERAREGIKINEGLLALGNVINALADDEQREGRRPHVPYRQSKLTRLLQDALGGNSQTLFLACVSPSTVNASETLSTLRYANRARNIKNAPVQNVDATVLELQRLRSWNQVLQSELLLLKFHQSPSPSTETNPMVEANLLERDDVKQYLAKLASTAESTQSMKTTLPVISTAAQQSANVIALTTPPATRIDVQTAPLSSGGLPERMGKTNSFDGVNPDDDMEILNHLLELQQRDQDFTDAQKEEHDRLKEVDGMLEKEQALLLRLRDNMKVYLNLKGKYEKLMAQVQQLETEKSELSVKLGKATDDPTQGCSTTIRRNMETVDRSLSRLRSEVQDHRKKCRVLEKEVQKCHALERKIADLRGDRAAMIKKQKEAGQRHREYTEKKQREIATLKRKEQKATHKMSKLQNEVEIHKKNLEKRQQYITKLSGKLEETKSHLSKLLSMRQRDLKRGGGHRRLTMTLPPPHQESKDPRFAGSTDEVESDLRTLRKSVHERVKKASLENKYQQQIAEYSETMRSMATAVDKLHQQSAGGNDAVEEDLQQTVLDMELKSELLGTSLESLETQMAETAKESEDDDAAMIRLIESKDSPVLRSVLLEVVELYASSEVSCTRLVLVEEVLFSDLLTTSTIGVSLPQLQSCETNEVLDRKQQAVESLEKEVDLLNQKVEQMSSDMARGQMPSSVSTDVASLTLSTELKDMQNLVASLETEKDRIRTDCAEAKEKLSVFEATSTMQENIEQIEPFLEELHDILRSMGRDREDEGFVESIQNSIRDTVQRKLEEAKIKKVQIESELDSAASRVSQIAQRLGVRSSELANDETLQMRLNKACSLEAELKTRLDNALTRQGTIRKGMENVMAELGVTMENLPSDLRELMEDSASQEINVHDSFLDKCEEHLSSLRLQRSEILVENSRLYDGVKELVRSAGLKATQALRLVERQTKSMPRWWSKEIARELTECLTSNGAVVRTTNSHTQHLGLISHSLTQILSCRRDLSRLLKELVEHAQKALLDTVDGESETVEAYSSFHEALFRLPELSKERINTFLSEIQALASCVEAMALSELEALTVVWEALNVSEPDRGAFWKRVENLEKDANSNGNKEFTCVLESAVKDGEDWVVKSAKDAQTKAAVLTAKLLKLDAVHKEVEKLRARQDAKSNILSLDSEVRILNAQLVDFENRKCNKGRLLSRQTGSSHLLKEERYRKQMKAKFSRKMEQLAGFLKGWFEEEGSKFDSNLLSEDVRKLLENSDQMGSWIEQRKEFMHLCTVKTDRKKRRLDSNGSTGSEQSEPNSQSRPKRSRVSPKADQVPARVTRTVSVVETSKMNESQRRNKRTPPSSPGNQSMKKQKTSLSPQEDTRARSPLLQLSSRPPSSQEPRRTNSPLPQLSRPPSSQEPTSTRSPQPKVSSRPPLSPKPKRTKAAPTKRATRSCKSLKNLSPKLAFPIGVPANSTKVPEKPSIGSSSTRKPLSTARVLSENVDTGNTAGVEERPTQRSSSRKDPSPKKSSSSNKSKYRTNETQATKRMTRSAAAEAAKKLVLPPFAHVLEKAFSPIDENSKEN